MDRPDLYDSDILAWSEQQSAALRRLAARHDLPNELDLDNVAEEIESVGRTELRAAESFASLILLHVAKAVSDPTAPAFSHWEIECVGWQGQLENAFSPSMGPRIDMEKLWRRALRQARLVLAEHGGGLAATLAAPCPVSLHDLLSESFDFRATIDRLVNAASS